METVNIIEGRSGRAWPAALRAIDSCRRAGRRVILYVPEQMTLQTERDVIAQLRLKGLLDIEVISPRKLRLLVRERTGGDVGRTLDEAGQMMAVHRAMTEEEGVLSFYRNLAELPGAADCVREALMELRDAGVTGEDLERCAEKASTGAAQAKIRDLNRIRNAYETLTAENFENEKQGWTDLVNRLESAGIFRDTDLIVYGFDTIRPDLREMLCKAAGLARQVQVFLTADGTDAPDGKLFAEQSRSIRQLDEALAAYGGKTQTIRIRTPRAGCGEMLRWMDTNLFAEEGMPYPGSGRGEISLYAAADQGEETEQIAECLLRWHREGIPWERMAVALPASAQMEKALRSRLRLSGIPFCSTEKNPAVSHGVFRLLTAAMECISTGYTSELAMEAALSGFSTLTEEEALLLGNYVSARGIEGACWRQPFTRGENAEETERLRQKLTGPIESLRGDLKAAETASESAEAIFRFLEAEGVRERLRSREQALLDAGMYREAVADRQMWKAMTEMLDEMWVLLGRRKTPIRELNSILKSAVSRISVSTLPETESGVVLGGIGHLNPGNISALALAGCQEGILSAPESGWLPDRDREAMERETGREIGISRERRAWIRRYDFYRTLTIPDRRLRISWSLRDEKGTPLREDDMVGTIRRIFPKTEVEGGVRGAQEELHPRTPLKALESMGTLFEMLRKGRSDEAGAAAASALLHSGAFGRTMQAMAAEAGCRSSVPILQPDTAKRLFHTDEISISRLERYAACPYQHFVDYGLRPVRQENFEYTDAEAGTFFHAALERFIRAAGEEQEWPFIPDERVDGIMDGICAELTEEWNGGPLREDALGIWQGEEYLRRAHHAARVLTRFAGNSDFRTAAAEQAFGKPGGLPPLVLHLSDGSRAAVQGIIDRIDLCRGRDGDWLRVVDYKSSGKKPEAAKMADGEQLQLMIYLQAASRAVPGARPAGAMFFPIQDTEVDIPDENPEAAEAERLRKVRMKGIVLAREEVLQAMDREIRPYSVDEVFKKDGTLKKSADWAVEEDVLKGLMDAAEGKAAEICAEIRAGRIEAAPRGTEDTSPCRYCSYRTLCRRRKDSFRPRDEGATYRDIAGKNTLREQ